MHIEAAIRVSVADFSWCTKSTDDMGIIRFLVEDGNSLS